MSLHIDLQSPEAKALQDSIQSELAKKDYAPDDDPVMAEYITVMLANNKNAETITSELVDLIGDQYDPAFTTWLFDLATGKSSVEAVSAAAPALPDQDEVEDVLGGGSTEESLRQPPPHLGPSSIFAKAIASSSTSPSSASTLHSGTKRSAADMGSAPAGGRENSSEPLSKRRVSGRDTPTGPRSLQDRVGPAPSLDDARQQQQNQDAFQTRIDALTHNAAAMNASLATAPKLSAPVSHQNGRSPGGQRNGGGRQQQQQMMMGGGMPAGMMGGMGMMAPGMGMGMQEMMMAQMAQMQMLQQQMHQIATAGGLIPQQQQPPHSQHPSSKSNSRSAANKSNSKKSSTSSKAATISSPVAVPTAPTSPELCKYSLACSNPSCVYSHPSPAATPESALVLSTEPCEAMRECKDPDCLKSHISPAASKQGPTPLPCKYQNCNNPTCPFLHTNAAGEPIPPPAQTDPSLASTTSNKRAFALEGEEDGRSNSPGLGLAAVKKEAGAARGQIDKALGSALDEPLGGSSGGGKACKWGLACTRANCTFSHPPGRTLTGAIHRGGFSPYTKSKPTASFNNKSMSFNPNAKSFVPKSATNMSERFAGKTEGGGEKIIPGSTPAKTDPTPPTVPPPSTTAADDAASAAPSALKTEPDVEPKKEETVEA